MGIERLPISPRAITRRWQQGILRTMNDLFPQHFNEQYWSRTLTFGPASLRITRVAIPHWRGWAIYALVQDPHGQVKAIDYPYWMQECMSRGVVKNPLEVFATVMNEKGTAP